MLFSSIEFLFYFLPVFLIAYYITPMRYKNLVLLVGSLVFYAWGEHFYVLLLLLSIAVNYTFGRLIGERQDKKKMLLILALIYNFGLLVFFKYTNFLIENINVLLNFIPRTNSKSLNCHAAWNQLLHLPNCCLPRRCLPWRSATS